MAKFLVALAVLAVCAGVWLSTESETAVRPEPITYGRDNCAQCRMILSQKGFAAEVFDSRGRVLKFDDPGCLVKMLQASALTPTHTWLEDNSSGLLIPLELASVVHGSSLTTPMDFGFVAYSTRALAEAAIKSHGGRLLSGREMLKTTVRRMH